MDRRAWRATVHAAAKIVHVCVYICIFKTFQYVFLPFFIFCKLYFVLEYS